MKTKFEHSTGVQELCRRLKGQLDDLAVTIEKTDVSKEEKARRAKLLEQLRKQLNELSI
jgi:HD superfamily phosphohydrolase